MSSEAARRVVLDASAALAWVLNERGASTVTRLLPVAVIPASVMVETLYRAMERGHRLPIRELHDAMPAIGAAVEPVTDADTVAAAELILLSRARRAHPGEPCLSLGDGLCIAVAQRLQLPVTGDDRLWERLDLGVRCLPFR